jgi:hypothetical protein
MAFSGVLGGIGNNASFLGGFFSLGWHTMFLDTFIMIGILH